MVAFLKNARRRCRQCAARLYSKLTWGAVLRFIYESLIEWML